MIKNKDYKVNKTVKKGIDQLINILSSAGVSTVLVIVLQLLSGKDVDIKDVKEIIDSLSQMGILLVPVISALITVINNIRKHYYKKL